MTCPTSCRSRQSKNFEDVFFHVSPEEDAQHARILNIEATDADAIRELETGAPPETSEEYKAVLCTLYSHAGLSITDVDVVQRYLTCEGFIDPNNAILNILGVISYTCPNVTSAEEDVRLARRGVRRPQICQVQASGAESPSTTCHEPIGP